MWAQRINIVPTSFICQYSCINVWFGCIKIPWNSHHHCYVTIIRGLYHGIFCLLESTNVLSSGQKEGSKKKHRFIIKLLPQIFVASCCKYWALYATLKLRRSSLWIAQCQDIMISWWSNCSLRTYCPSSWTLVTKYISLQYYDWIGSDPSWTVS